MCLFSPLYQEYQIYQYGNQYKDHEVLIRPRMYTSLYNP